MKQWLKSLSRARQRCNNPNASRYDRYGGRGIKCLLTVEEIEFIWKRDKADSLKQPSLDRIDCDGNYTFDNCQFIEMNVNRGKRTGKISEEAVDAYIKNLPDPVPYIEPKQPPKKIDGIELPKFNCLHCLHIWTPRKNDKPRVCPACKSARWDKPKLWSRKNKKGGTHE